MGMHIFIFPWLVHNFNCFCATQLKLFHETTCFFIRIYKLIISITFKNFQNAITHLFAISRAIIEHAYFLFTANGITNYRCQILCLFLVFRHDTFFLACFAEALYRFFRHKNALTIPSNICFAVIKHSHIMHTSRNINS